MEMGVGCETGPFNSVFKEGNGLASTAVIDFENAWLGQSPDVQAHYNRSFRP